MPPRLSVRQEQCVRLTAFRTDKEIAAHLGISEATVKKHVHEACRRLGVNRRKAALAILEREEPGRPSDPVADSLQDEDQLHDLSDDVSAPARALNVAGAAGAGFPYRVPPRGLLFRLTLIVVIAVLICALLIAVLWMVGEIHHVVGHLDLQSS